MPTIRLYYNKRGPLPWSVDEGVDTEEKQVKEVLVLEVNGHTRVDFTFDTVCFPDRPSAWMEFTRASVRVIDNTAVIREDVVRHAHHLPPP